MLVEAWSYRRRAPRVGEVVLATDPRDGRRELVKRVVAVDGDQVTLAGDNSAASTDSRDFGPVPVSAIAWRVIARYWPRPRVFG